MKNILLISMFIICCSTWLQGQKSITDSIFSIQEVEVLGKQQNTKQELQLLNMNVPLKFLPVTVTKLDGKILERKNITNMEDAVRFLPGVTVTDQLGAFQRYSIRGISDAVVAIDGIRDERSLMTNVPFGDLSSVESIEVIKGPASILSGHSVMGGVINIIRKKPVSDFTAHARLSYGSWNEKQATLGFGGKIIGPVNYYANVHYSQGDGYRDVNADRFSGLFTVGAKIARTGYLEANVSFNDDHYSTEIGAAPLMPGDVFLASTGELYAKASTFNPMADYHTVYNDLANNSMRRRNMDVSVQYTQQLTGWMDVRDRFTYGHSNLDYSCVEGMGYRESNEPIYDWYYKNKKGQIKYIELDSLQSNTPLCFNPDNITYTNTLDFTGEFTAGPISNHYTLGWNYTHFNYTQYNGYADDDVWGPGLNQMLPLNNPHIVRNWWDSKVSAASIREYTTHGIYLHDVIELNEHWKGMAGVRMDIYRYKNASATIADGRQHYDKANRTDWKKVSTSALTYRVGIVYLPIQEVSLYASAASYFKPNTSFYNPNVVYMDRNGKYFNPDIDGGEVFSPEKGNQFEAGIRYALNNVWEINASAYYIRKFNVVKNLGSVNVEENGSSVEKNVQAQVGRADDKGFDFDITYRPFHFLQLVGGWGWSDYRIKSSKFDPVEFPEFSEVTNQRARNIPRTTFYTYADYTIPKGILKDLSFHLSGTFTDRIYISTSNEEYRPSYYIVDAGVFYTIKKSVCLALNINNLFDKKYFVKNTVVGKPCNFMASITYTFH